MDVTRNEFEDLVGAYALDACEPDEAAAIDAFIAENADAADEAERLRGAAAWLGAVGALNPPVALRDRLLAAMADRPDPLPPVDALRQETERFEALLDSLEPADLDVQTYNGLSVRDLVAHIAIVDEAFVAEAPLPGFTVYVVVHRRGRRRADDRSPASRSGRLVVPADPRSVARGAPLAGRRSTSNCRPTRASVATRSSRCS